MTAHGSSAAPSGSGSAGAGPLGAPVRRLDDPSSASLAGLVATFDELQMVLRCCERLVNELAAAGAGGPDELLVEAVWTTALLSYARCFAGDDSDGGPGALSEEDLTASQPQAGVLEWHRLLLQLRDHYADRSTNPRERFSVGVTQDSAGAASGVAITSVRQPLVDEVTVRQTGAVAYALSGFVNDRIESQQQTVFDELKLSSKANLDKLELLDLDRPAHPGA
ncbi:hypothetical protein [Microlunatus ginsengisoli]|uniref:Uncharacterized protein n=1 Tax=Microlunatus ginsengisoli TaxID=363863 RepID=A0ABP7ARJ6_9ACTN